MRTRIRQLSDRVYIIRDDENCTGYLVVGAEKAAVIDTLNGLDDLKALVRTVTDLPIIVINTHGHGDHCDGNRFFDEAYLNKADWDMIDEAEKTYKINDVNDGDVFDLGGVTLIAVACDGHTKGGICLLDKEDRLLFTGDAVNCHCWMQLDHSSGIRALIKALEGLKPIRGDFDRILHGHADGYIDGSQVDKMIKGANEILNGDTKDDKVYKWFGDDAKQHVYDPDGSLIVYNDESITK